MTGSLERVAQVFKKLPHLLTPPLVDVVRLKLRDRGRPRPLIPDHELYQPIFSPWLGGGAFGALRDEVQRISLVSSDRIWVLYILAKNCLNRPGDFVECGVYKGGTAKLLAQVLAGSDNAIEGRRLMLFDTFAGMPETDSRVDKHLPGDFSNTSLEQVKRAVGEAPHIEYHPGFIPDSFAGARLERISLLHVDLDIRQSILDTLEQCYDLVVPGGVIVFDDYGFESCFGARIAVDSFFEDKIETHLCLPTGQAIVIKSG